MPRIYDTFQIYALTAPRDRAALERFLAHYVDRETFEVRHAGTTRAGPCALWFAPPDLRPVPGEEVWVDVRSLRELVDAACAPRAEILTPVRLPAAPLAPDLSGVAVSSMSDGAFVLGLGVDADPGGRIALGRSPADGTAVYRVQRYPTGRQRAARWLRALCRRCGCARGYACKWQAPREPEDVATAWDDYAFLWYPRRPPYEMPTHPRRAFRFAAPDPWEWLTRAAPPAAPAGWEWVMDLATGRSFHPSDVGRLQREAAALAAAVLDGRARLVAVARRVAELLHWCGLRAEHDPDAEAFRRIRAACDVLPVEDEFEDLPPGSPAAAAREQEDEMYPLPDWFREAATEEVARLEAWARGFGLAACGRLVQRFGARRDR